MSLGVKKLTYDSILPTRGSSGSVGYDLYSNMDCVIHASERGLVSTGITVVLPSGVYGRVAPDLDSPSSMVSRLGLVSLIQTIRVKSKSFSSIMGTKTLRLRRVIASLSSFLRSVRHRLSLRSIS